ncbi:hypothetical protein ACFVAV_21490 [Nocardia sp. NPDC057663]|uniref:hypothetical protein n=1 Tax=Nocardia sp. NPDC057663 TaxID=3346201 RepID=UPI00366ABCB9
MSKIRVFGAAVAAAASIAMLGAGVAAAADEPTTGSADAILTGLGTGTAETEPVAEEPAGSLEGLDLAALLELLSSGSGEAPAE